MSNKSRGQRAETALRAILQERGYLVIRSAASKVYDLVCVDEGGFVMFLEVKSVKDGNVFRVSRTKMAREQHAQMQRDVARYEGPSSLFLYAVRFPDGEYRFYYAHNKIMPQTSGYDIDFVFPARITPNNPPIIPQEAMSDEVADCCGEQTFSDDALDPDGDTRDAQC